MKYTKRTFTTGDDLHDLLLEACPPDAEGNQSIPLLAAALDISHQAVFKWLQTRRVPADRAVAIASLSKGRVPLRRFYPYVFGDVTP